MSAEDAEIEAQLDAAAPERWDELWDALDALGEGPYATWSGGDGSLPYPEYSEATERLLAAIRGAGLVTPFAWVDWDGVTRYAGGVGLAEAPVADAVRMITVVLRSERFSDGSIEGALESGTLQAAVARLRVWRSG